MYITELIEYLSKPDRYRQRPYSEKELREMADIDNETRASDLQMIFCYEKAMHDPSDRIRDMQKRIRSKNPMTDEDEDFLAYTSATLQMSEFEYYYCLQMGIRDALYELDHAGKNNHLHTLEWWYELNCM